MEAQRIGLVSRVTAADDLFESALQTARSICEAPAATLRFAKEFFTGNAGRGFEESFEIEHDEAFRRIILKTMNNPARRTGTNKEERGDRHTCKYPPRSLPMRRPSRP